QRSPKTPTTATSAPNSARLWIPSCAPTSQRTAITVAANSFTPPTSHSAPPVPTPQLSGSSPSPTRLATLPLSSINSRHLTKAVGSLANLSAVSTAASWNWPSSQLLNRRRPRRTRPTPTPYPATSRGRGSASSPTSSSKNRTPEPSLSSTPSPMPNASRMPSSRLAFCLPLTSPSSPRFSPTSPHTLPPFHPSS